MKYIIRNGGILEKYKLKCEWNNLQTVVFFNSTIMLRPILLEVMIHLHQYTSELNTKQKFPIFIL